MKPRLTLTIHHKLIALIVGLMVAVVGALAIYLSQQQIDAMATALRTKAATYGSVMASQTTSAVAFSDRETAREVLHSIDADGDVASVALFGDRNVQLYSRGELSTPPSELAGTAQRVLATGSRIAAITPVVSLEGPRGAIVIELSTDSLHAARHHIHMLALTTGLVALAVGILAAWLIARRLARRLRAIANVASAVAGGDLGQPSIDDPQRDEIGVLAAAFNAMLGQIKQLIAHVQELARKEQDRLEHLVAERTAQLDQRNSEMQLVFDQVDQGLLMVDLDGTIARERSAAVERLLGAAPAGNLFDYLRQVAPEAVVWFELQWEALRDGALPPALCLAQLPSHLELGARHLELAYKLTETGDRPRILVVISDATEHIERQRAERDERETASLLTRLLRGRAGFLAFHAEAGQYITAIETGPRGDATFKRIVHTLKGTAAIEGIHSIAALCHALEDAMEEGDELAVLASSRALVARWELLTSKLAPLIAASADRLEVLPADLERLEAVVRRGGASAAELLAILEGWRHERVQPRMQRFADDALALADRLGKGPVEVTVDAADELRLPLSRWSEFWTTFVHAIRNAVDHGLETADERHAAGKPAVAQLALRARKHGDAIMIEIADTGRGIDWHKVADRARERGLPFASHGDLVDALFHDGFTTRDEATELSGRGVGLSALRHACVSTGGHIEVVSQRGTGTTFRFHWPSSAALSSPSVLQRTA